MRLVSSVLAFWMLCGYVSAQDLQFDAPERSIRVTVPSNGGYPDFSVNVSIFDDSSNDRIEIDFSPTTLGGGSTITSIQAITATGSNASINGNLAYLDYDPMVQSIIAGSFKVWFYTDDPIYGPNHVTGFNEWYSVRIAVDTLPENLPGDWEGWDDPNGPPPTEGDVDIDYTLQNYSGQTKTYKLIDEVTGDVLGEYTADPYSITQVDTIIEDYPNPVGLYETGPLVPDLEGGLVESLRQLDSWDPDIPTVPTPTITTQDIPDSPSAVDYDGTERGLIESDPTLTDDEKEKKLKIIDIREDAEDSEGISNIDQGINGDPGIDTVNPDVGLDSGDPEFALDSDVVDSLKDLLPELPEIIPPGQDPTLTITIPMMSGIEPQVINVDLSDYDAAISIFRILLQAVLGILFFFAVTRLIRGAFVDHA